MSEGGEVKGVVWGGRRVIPGRGKSNAKIWRHCCSQKGRESVHAGGGTFVRIQEADSGETEALSNPEWP